MIQILETLIKQAIQPDHLEVTGDGSHFQVIVVSDIFENLKPVQKQQKIYALVSDKIADGSLHAISIKTYTQKEWQQASKFL